MAHHLTWIQIVLTALAGYRVTQLLVRDTITEPYREWLSKTFNGLLVELFFCMWCMSVWVGAGVTLLTYFQWGWWQWVALGLAVSAFTGFLGERS